METYLTIEEVAKHLKLAEQTIRRYVLNREIPYHKIKKVIRFRLSEIERWVDGGGMNCSGMAVKDIEGDLFADVCRPSTDTGEPEGTGDNEEIGEVKA